MAASWNDHIYHAFIDRVVPKIAYLTGTFV